MQGAAAQEPGKVVGERYRLVRCIGEGGMATVWEAEHMTLASPVAVKLLRWNGGGSDHVRERFLREARLAASVRHRNVVAIEDFGFEDGVPFIVMELLSGEPLSKMLERRGRLSPREAARMVSLALRGLAAVHEQGIVHRDLKPDNIFIVHDPDGTYPKLLDFGVCRGTRRAAGKDITQEGTLLGTPEYMSPEQARGLPGVDARSDVYSMGVILYEALTGHLPHESPNVGDLLVKISCDPPTPVTHWVPDLAPHLVALLERALARDPADRFASARDMRRELIAAFQAEGFSDYESGVVTNATRRVSRPDAETIAASTPAPGRGRRGWLLFAAVLAAAVAAGLLYPAF